MNKIRFIVIAFLASTMFFACKPEAYKEVGEPANNIIAVTGSWQLAKVVQVDKDAENKGFPFKEADLTSLFPYTEFRLTLNSANGAPTTFTTTPGNSPRIITLASGTWSVDDIKTPKVITLTSGSTSQKITLGAYPNAVSRRLKVSLERRSTADDKLLIGYSYEFVKQ